MSIDAKVSIDARVSIDAKRSRIGFETSGRER
jgi:hypothetical protein